MGKLKAYKQWIDEASYEELLREWRHAFIGDEIFVGETGEYFAKVMNEKKALLSNEERVMISKKVGW